MLSKIFSPLVDIIFPSLCLNCREKTSDGSAICEFCFKNIPINNAFFCGKCRARLPENKKICHQSFPYVLGAAGDYQNGNLKSLIHGLKFRFIKKAAEPLAEILANYVEKIPWSPDKFIVIPIPLGHRRLRQRGFNQSELIAEIFARRLDLPAEKRILIRAKNTAPQSETKNLEERNGNVKGCFLVVKPESIAGRNIILIDDVTTSGATFLEASLALKEAGARRIVAMAAAKA